MTVNVYRFDDPGAPVLTGLAGSLVALLDACLVTGYDVKPGAGWSKPFADVNKAVYQQGAGSNGFFLQVDASAAQCVAIRGFTAMSDLLTGTGQFPTVAQLASGARITVSNTTDATARPWLVAADSKRFYLFTALYDTTTTGLLMGISRGVMTFFGDITSYRLGDAYGTVLIGQTGTYESSNYFGYGNFSMSGIDGHYIARTYDQLTESLKCGKIGDIRGVSPTTGQALLGGNGAAYPDPITGGMLLGPIYITELTKLTRGHLPGMWAPLHSGAGVAGTTFEGTSEGGLAGKTFILLNASASGSMTRLALEISDTWE